MTSRERCGLHESVECLLRDLATGDSPKALFTLAGQRLDALVSPQSCVIYAPLDDWFTPVFARDTKRQVGPPAWSANAAALVALRGRIAPLQAEQGASARARPLAPEECAALERLRAAVILPVCRDSTLVAIICLGDKRSGEIYTSTDLTLLVAVADKLSEEFLRFDTAVIVRQEREMGEALRR